MKSKLFLLLLSIALVAACKKAGSESQPDGRENQVIQEEEGNPASPATQAVAIHTATTKPAATPTQAVAAYTATPEPTITPSNTPRPINTPRPSWTPTATPTWWGLSPATPANDVTPTPLPSPTFDPSSAPVYVNDTVVVDPDRQAKWVEALSPLPQLEFPIDDDSDETMTVTLEFKPVQLIEINLDQDEAPESVLAYSLVPPGYSEEIFTLSEYEAYNKHIRFYYGDVQVAVFDDGDSELLGKSEPIPLEFTTTIELSSVNLSANLKGVYFSLWGLDTMRESNATSILYIWDDSELKAAWRWEKEFVSLRSGAGIFYGTQPRDQITVQDVDSDGFEELLFVHRIYNFQDTSGCCFSHYYLSYPGALVYKWNDDGVRSAFLLTEDGLYPIRPQTPTALAPYVDRPIIVDGDVADWHQVEYVNDYHDLTYDECGIPGGVKLVWDDDNLYIRFLLLPEEEVTLALDTDFETDFAATTFDMDEAFITVRVDQAEILHLNFESAMFGEDMGVVAAVGERIYAQSFLFPVEISIPLEQLGLDEIRLTSAVGWGNVDAHLDSGFADEHEYYPTVQAMVGFAIATDQENDEPMCFEFDSEISVGTAVFDMTNPTTWGTLVFTADRGTPND